MEAKLLKIGCLIEAEAFRGERIERRVVEISGDNVYICRDEEWREAQLHRREPECVGFKQRSILRLIKTP